MVVPEPVVSDRDVDRAGPTDRVGTVRVDDEGGAVGDWIFVRTARKAEPLRARIERPKLHVYIGKDARIMNVLVRVAPKQAAKLIHRQMKSLLEG